MKQLLDLWGAGSLKPVKRGGVVATLIYGLANWPLGTLTVAALLGGRLIKHGWQRHRQMIDSQEAFWTDILPSKGILKDCEFIAGGNNAKRDIDDVRKNKIPGAVFDYISRATFPLITTAIFNQLERIEESKYWPRPPRVFQNIKSYVDPFSVYLAPHRDKILSRIRFVRDISLAKRQLLLPLGGAISNNIARQHLFETNPLRNYQLIARIPKQGLEIVLSDLDSIGRVQDFKRLFVENPSL